MPVIKYKKNCIITKKILEIVLHNIIYSLQCFFQIRKH